MKKKSLILCLGSLLALSALAGCSSDDGSVKLTIWGGELEASQNWLKSVSTAFQAAYPDTKFNITIGAVSEGDVKTQWLKDPNAAADVAIGADDQVNTLVEANDLANITTTDATIAADVESRNSAISVASSKVGDSLYAFPVSASNGFFLYYDSRKLSLTDCTTFDSLLAAIKAKSIADGKTYRFGFPATSLWYLGGWFEGAGYHTEQNDSGVNNCEWNSTTKTPSGVKVAGALTKLAQGEYKTYWDGESDSNIMTKVADDTEGQIIATINGTWSANTITEKWGDGAAATVMPSYTIDGTNYAMKTVAGHKVAFVNAYSKNLDWSIKFANFMTSKAEQIDRYNVLAEAPSNTSASSEIDLTKNYAVAALSKQMSTNAFSLNVSGSYWTDEGAFDQALNDGKNGDVALCTGNGTANVEIVESAMQDALDTAVATINAASK
jgi:arabinogalactan oligomer/maltooligosaccharide transport system substrate-binding protein